MTDWLFRVQASLSEHRAGPIVWETGQAKLLLSVTGARMLGCAMPGAGVTENLFWHEPKLEDAATAKSILSQGGIGGDRLWIAPEAGFIFTDVKKARKDPLNNATVPLKMDPGSWRVVEQEQGHLRLTTDMMLRDHRNGKTVTLRVARQFNLTSAPEGLPARLLAASFSIRNELTMLKGDAGVAAGVWDLLQLPPTGWLVCPTVQPVKKLTSYYDPFGRKHVAVDKAAVRFLIDGKRRIKMGFPADKSTGRLGYYRKLAKGKSSLIVRMFGPMPGEPYVDVPLASDAFFGGDCVQAYNDDGTFGGFGEMEYHDPAIVAGRYPNSRMGTNLTHVLVGPDKDIRAAGLMLLGVKLG